MIKNTFKSGQNKKMNYPTEVEKKLFLYFYNSGIFMTFLMEFG